MTATARRRATDRPRPGVVVIGTNAALRNGLRLALEATADCYEAVTAADAAALASRAWLDVCLVVADRDESLAIAELSRNVPQARIVVVTADVEEAGLLAAVRAGAIGYLPTAVEPARLPFVVRGVMRGEAAIPRVLVSRLVEELRDRAKRRRLMLDRREAVDLTAREWEVLEQLRRRKQTKEIAASLTISEVTVRRHIGSIVRKLHVAGRDEAAALVQDWTFV